MTARRLLGVVGLASVLCLPVLADAQETTRGFAPTTIPRTIPIFPLPDVMLFPGATRPLHIFESRYREMVADALEGDRLIGMVLLQPGYEADYTGRPPVYPVGCIGVIRRGHRAPGRPLQHPAGRPDQVPHPPGGRQPRLPPGRRGTDCRRHQRRRPEPAARRAAGTSPP